MFSYVKFKTEDASKTKTLYCFVLFICFYITFVMSQPVVYYTFVFSNKYLQIF